MIFNFTNDIHIHSKPKSNTWPLPTQKRNIFPSFQTSGGLIVDIPDLATVLVSDRVYRTCKFLCAIAKGIPIVGQPYLDATNAKQDFVDPWDYILQDLEMERRFKFNLKKSLTLARESKLLQDYSVIVTPSTKPPPDELQCNCHFWPSLITFPRKMLSFSIFQWLLPVPAVVLSSSPPSSRNTQRKCSSCPIFGIRICGPSFANVSQQLRLSAPKDLCCRLCSTTKISAAIGWRERSLFLTCCFFYTDKLNSTYPCTFFKNKL